MVENLILEINVAQDTVQATVMLSVLMILSLSMEKLTQKIGNLHQVILTLE
jgi:hypothetical protein